MAYVPGCRHDIFISYASENNRDGWVEQFVTSLGHELTELLGRHFIPKESVFFDKRELEVGQSFPERLTTSARESAILLPILSPSYLTSVWCDLERTAFFEKLPHGAGPADCLAPILIRPIDSANLIQLYRDAQWLSFLSGDGQSPLTVGSPEWYTRVKTLAGQLRNALRKLRQKCRPVFLGKAADTDRSRDLRARCKTEIEKRFLRTAPEALQVLDDSDRVRASLQEAGMAIHFLGRAGPAALEAIEMSVEVCTGPTILYQPFGADLSRDEQFWLYDFERSVQARTYQRLTGKSEQELLALIDDQTTRSREDSATAPQRVDLALVCDEADLHSARQLNDDILGRGVFALAFPDFLGMPLRAMDRLRKLTEYLSQGEAHLFYHGAAERIRLELIWKKAESDWPGARRNWYLAPPDLEEKLRNQPGALTTVEQVIRFVEQGRSANA